jgi:hypothetical protein
LSSGEFAEVGNGAAACGTVDAEISPLSSNSYLSRPSVNQRTRLEDTPLRGEISKETLRFSLLEPTVLSIIWEFCFFVLKTYFFSVN